MYSSNPDVLSYNCKVNELDDDSESIYKIKMLPEDIRSNKLNLFRAHIIAAKELYKILNTGNLESLIPNESISTLLVGKANTKALLRIEILRYVRKRFEEAPDIPIYIFEILVAVNDSPKSIISALQNLNLRNLIQFKRKLENFETINLYEDQSKVLEQLFMYLDISFSKASEIEDILEKHDSSEFRLETTFNKSLNDYSHYKIIQIDADNLPDGFVFYMTQFDESNLQRFSIIKEFCKEQYDLELIISKDDNRPNNLNNTIISHIRKCKFGIADVTAQNPNVMYELGFAHAINKEVILISYKKKKKRKRIFDIDNINTIYFNDHDNLKEELIKQIPAVLQTLSDR